MTPAVQKSKMKGYDKDDRYDTGYTSSYKHARTRRKERCQRVTGESNECKVCIQEKEMDRVGHRGPRELPRLPCNGS